MLGPGGLVFLQVILRFVRENAGALGDESLGLDQTVQAGDEEADARQEMAAFRRRGGVADLFAELAKAKVEAVDLSGDRLAICGFQGFEVDLGEVARVEAMFEGVLVAEGGAASGSHIDG